ncbi:ras-associated and pleckstrin homology domains-containing protein 1-like isoform X1 [Solea solea]|uniref:ras-associated and pleckstrin homology domains-containing protein 1-like isoform X1 n=2 Tax=Solea solea TaxID=90069 RepID=UPI00272B66AB|nr:ras-associated and pleckstrin homology domains-containing protein 1-like isoform X1 [Solea solea]XP_058508962.1 ras-associated and pleckstrin homology domains-containing protein 1-like isoform X1 [Solea solea]
MTPPKPPRKSLMMKSSITNGYDTLPPAYEEPDALKPAVTDEVQPEFRVKPVPRPRSKILPKPPPSDTTNSAVDSGNETSSETTAVSCQHDEEPAPRLQPVRPPPRPPPIRCLTSTTADVYGGSQNSSSNTETTVNPPAVRLEKRKSLPPPARPPPPAIYYERVQSMRGMPRKTNSVDSQQSTVYSTQQTDSAGFPEEVATPCETYAEKATDATDRPTVPPRLHHVYGPSPTQTRPPPPAFNPPPPPPPPYSTGTQSESVYSEIEHRPYLDVLPEDENTTTSVRSMPRSGLRYQSGCFSSRHQSKKDADEIIVMLRWLTRVSKSDMTPSLYGLSLEEEIRSFEQRAMHVSKALRLYNLLLMKRSDCMRSIIAEFNSISHNLDKMKKKAKTMGIAGGTTGAVGGVTAVIGIALAPVTMGASLIATAVGAGMVASAGGMGAHTVKANKKTVNRTTVERLAYDYKGNIVDIEHCLEFILSGMNDLRRHDIARLHRAGAQSDALKMAHLSQTVFQNNADNEKKTSCGLSSQKLLRDFAKELDQYFTEEEGEMLKKSNKSRFSGRVRLLAENLQDHLEYLVRMWEMFS